MSVPSASRLRPSLRACTTARLQRDAVGSGSCRASPRMTNRSAAELQDRIIAKNGHKLRHVPNMNATRSHGEHARLGKPRLIEVMAWAVFNFGDICCAHHLVDADRGGAVAFEFADDRAIVQMVRADNAAPLCKHAPVHAMILLAIHYRVH